MKEFLRRETVLVAAMLLAAVSSFLNPPGAEYLSYIDFRVLGILLSLMLVMAGFQKEGVFAFLGGKMIEKAANARQLGLVLVFLCFFSAMIMTNDVALITFVPFSILTLRMADLEEHLIPVVTAQTIAANLGSMLTPIGNPQNLYLYGKSGLGFGSFLKLMIPYALVAAVLLFLFMLLIPRETLQLGDFTLDTAKVSRHNIKKALKISAYILLFLVSLLCVFHVLPWQSVLTVVMLSVFLMDKKVLLRADYSLLLTFIAFFIFIGNMGEIPTVREGLSELLRGHELLISVLSSQVISNVPAAILLSGFTTDYAALIIGTNLGGLGTLIASMASLISYKLFVNAHSNKKGQYFATFTVWNVIFLTVLLLTYSLIHFF